MIREFYGEKTKKFSRFLGKIVQHLPLTPNQWSLLSLIPAALGLYAVAVDALWWGFALFAAAGLWDQIDGGLARLTGQTTKLGAYIDGVMDRFVDFLLVFSFLFLNLPNVLIPVEWWVTITAYFGLMPTFIVAYVNHREAVPDPTETVVWRILHRAEMYPLFLLVLITAVFSLQWAAYLLVTVAALTVVTTLQSFLLGVKKSYEYGTHTVD